VFRNHSYNRQWQQEQQQHGESGCQQQHEENLRLEHQDVDEGEENLRKENHDVDEGEEKVRECCVVNQERMELAVARFFCRAAIPFNAAGCDEYKEMFRLINPLFVPPTPQQLRGPLLKRTLEDLDKEIQSPSGSRSRLF
jgi:hypothetical protein